MSVDDWEFPHRRLFTTQAQMNRAFDNLREYKFVIKRAQYKITNMPELEPADLKYLGESRVIACSRADYENMNFLSDCFNHAARAEARRYDSPHSPMDYWTLHKSAIIAECREKFKKITYKNLEQLLYARERGAGTFRASIMVGFIRMFDAKYVLNICAGWGDRLIGAIANDAYYVGVDPNKKLAAGYDEIIAMFARDPAKYKMILEPFEDAVLPALPYDLVIMAPPYFDLEIYDASSPEQSTTRYPTLDVWFDNFLMASIHKGINALARGGVFIMVMNDIRERDHCTLKMRDTTSAIPELEYLGMLPYADEYHGGKLRSPQPVWIWRKK